MVFIICSKASKSSNWKWNFFMNPHIRLLVGHFDTLKGQTDEKLNFDVIVILATSLEFRILL